MRMSTLQKVCSRSFAATIEVSLASPIFQELGPDAQELLAVIAFSPQGVVEKNLNRLFPTRTGIFDKLCVLSLTYRSRGFITMLAPLRDYFCPKDPKSSPLLLKTKEGYFTWMSANIDPNKPDHGEPQWIMSEDRNVEHLLDVFMAIDADSCFRPIIPWQCYFSVKAGSTTHRLALNKPSRTLSTTHTAWPARWSYRLGFGTDSTGLKRRGPGLGTLP